MIAPLTGPQRRDLGIQLRQRPGLAAALPGRVDARAGLSLPPSRRQRALGPVDNTRNQRAGGHRILVWQHHRAVCFHQGGEGLAAGLVTEIVGKTDIIDGMGIEKPAVQVHRRGRQDFIDPSAGGNHGNPLLHRHHGDVAQPRRIGVRKDTDDQHIANCARLFQMTYMTCVKQVADQVDIDPYRFLFLHFTIGYGHALPQNRTTGDSATAMGW